MDEGIVFKVAENMISKNEQLKLHSLNPLYEPFDVHVKDIREVWKFIHYISGEVPEPNMPREELIDSVKRLQKQVQAIQTRLDLPE